MHVFAASIAAAEEATYGMMGQLACVYLARGRSREETKSCRLRTIIGLTRPAASDSDI
jgi:hypothetical protein